MRLGVIACLLLSTSLGAAADDGLVAHWDFNEGKGNVLRDRSGNKNHGKIHGARWVKNGTGFALEFDGIDDHVDCGTGTSLDLKDAATLEAWVWFEPPTAHGEAGIIGKAFPSYVMTRFRGKVFAYISGGPYNRKCAVPDRSWHHLVSTYDGKRLRLYVDGRLANERPLDLNIRSGERFWMGRSDGEFRYTQDAHFHGRIAEARVYNRALTHDEIARHFWETNLTNTVGVAAVPIPWQSRIVAEIDVRPLGKGTRGLVGDVRLHEITRSGKPARPAVATATATAFDPLGLAFLSLPADRLRADRYLLRVVARTAAGKQIGVPASTAIDWVASQEFPSGPSGARKLNNLVAELLNVRGPEATGKTHSFVNPRTGWVFFSNEGAAEITLQGERVGTGRIVPLLDKHGSINEAMRRLPKGRYTISTPSAKGLVVRAIPHLVFNRVNSNPKIKEFGPHVGAFQEKYVHKNINTFIWASRAGTPLLEKWHARGKHWIGHCRVPKGTHDKPITVEQAYQFLLKQKRFNNPCVTGLAADEYAESEPHCAVWAKAVDRFLSQPEHRGKLYIPFGNTLWDGDPGRELIRALIKHDSAIMLKCYLGEQRTEAAAWRYIDQRLVDAVTRYRENAPGSVPLLIITFGWHMCAPNESLDTLPHVNFKTYVEMQLNALANHPACRGVGGVMTYSAAFADEETIRWTMRLLRHYCIEGKTDMLSSDPYHLPHLQSPDFESGGLGWRLSPAEKGSIRFDVHAGFAHLAQRVPRSADGTTVIVMRRSAGRPNTFSQTIGGLQPGRLYNLRMFSSDFNDLSLEQKHAVAIRVENADLIREKCFTAVFHNHASHKFPPYGGKGKRAWMNYHWRVFRAKGRSAGLTVSDWESDEEPGGPIGQELMFNFIQVQPYYPERQK